ncbi:hypothetical protein QZH41_016828 [Actinostola sp. cb2023]|nr:hypothetical protein QZH41_016828 [Actinostola sp. cb2023]
MAPTFNRTIKVLSRPRDWTNCSIDEPKTVDKPRNAVLTIDRATVCQNDTVNITCTSGPANPPANSYKFYYNSVLVQNSSSNVYVTKATRGSPEVNRFTCVPSNLLGDSVQNGTLDVTAKVAPSITQTTTNPVVIEGSNLYLTCNVSGTTPLNVTWTRSGKPDVQGMVYSITNIKRSDEGVYRCTVNNGAECPARSATINVTVNYFEHCKCTSSLRHPNANGKAEARVKAAKTMLSKCAKSNTDPYIAFLEIRNTPTQGTVSSPAENY